MAVTVLIAYDIHSDDDRARVAAMLQSCGDRIQRSVFLCLIEPDDLAVLLDRLARLINPHRDLLHAFPLCANCATHADARGQAVLEEPPPFWIV